MQPRGLNLIAATATLSLAFMGGCADDDDNIDRDDAGGDSATDGESAGGSAGGSGGGNEGGGGGGETGGPGSDSGDSGDGGLVPGEHECAALDTALEAIPCSGQPTGESEPNETGQTASPMCIGTAISAAIDVAGDEDYYEFTVPDAPYGGYVQVHVENVGPTSRFEVEIRAAADNGSIRTDGGADFGADRAVWFAAAPGQSFRAAVRQWSLGDPGPYTLRAEWVPAFDCYEGNDTRQEAKWIPVNETVDAMTFTGHRDSNHPSERDHDDWYRVVLDRGPVAVAVTDPPSNSRTEVQLLDAQGERIVRDGTTDGGAFVSLQADVEAGLYHVVVTQRFQPLLASGRGLDVPANFTEPYQLTVTQ